MSRGDISALRGAAPNGGGEGRRLGESGGLGVSETGSQVGAGGLQLGCDRGRGVKVVHV